MGKYDDIIHMPHHQSETRPHMSEYNRAAQFSPFAALTGHDAAIAETARLTERRVELDEDEKRLLDLRMKQLYEKLSEHPAVKITYFVADANKNGGAYCTEEGNIWKMDLNARVLILRKAGQNGLNGYDALETKILMDDIYDLEGI